MAWPDLTLLATLAITLVAMAALWLVSLRLRDASIADLFWGPTLALVGWTSAWLAPVPSPRGILANVLVTIWAARLTVHLTRRSRGRDEDFRYRAMRERHGRRFPLVSLPLVFLSQGALVWIVSWPVQAVHMGPHAPLGVADLAGALLWLAGLVLEAVADAELARFSRDPANARQVMDRGLWRYSRHPNYFGDCLVWWGLGLLAVGQGAWWSLAGPIVMTVLLVKVSGVGLLESTIGDRRPGYRDYVRRTSAFVPMPPRRISR